MVGDLFGLDLGLGKVIREWRRASQLRRIERRLEHLGRRRGALLQLKLMNAPYTSRADLDLSSMISTIEASIQQEEATIFRLLESLKN
jgi:hypothetical protein